MVHGHKAETAYLANVGEDNDGADEQDGFLVHHVEFVGDGGGNEASSEESSASLGDEAGLGREFLDDFIGALGRGRCCEATTDVYKGSYAPVYDIEVQK